MSQIIFAIPSKGRLKEQAEAWLQSCGFRLRQIGGARGYRANLDGADGIELILLSAREIAERLLSGEIHVGVTGEDLLHELASDFDRQAVTLKRLGFGEARVVVAVPACWIDVDTLDDLESAGRQFREANGRRLVVATKYPRLTRAHFARHGVTEYRLVDSAGDTEAAPASGAADIIVDITTTGATLEANHLKVLADGEILASEAAFTLSRRAEWPGHAMDALSRLLDAMHARDTALAFRRLSLAAPIRAAELAPLADTYGLRAVGMVDESGTARLLAPVATANEAARQLAHLGHGPVEIAEADFTFESSHPLLDLAKSALNVSVTD